MNYGFGDVLLGVCINLHARQITVEDFNAPKDFIFKNKTKVFKIVSITGYFLAVTVMSTPSKRRLKEAEIH